MTAVARAMGYQYSAAPASNIPCACASYANAACPLRREKRTPDGAVRMALSKTAACRTCVYAGAVPVDISTVIAVSRCTPAQPVSRQHIQDSSNVAQYIRRFFVAILRHLPTLISVYHLQ